MKTITKEQYNYITQYLETAEEYCRQLTEIEIHLASRLNIKKDESGCYGQVTKFVWLGKNKPKEFLKSLNLKMEC